MRKENNKKILKSYKNSKKHTQMKRRKPKIKNMFEDKKPCIV